MQSLAILKIIKETRKNTTKNVVAKQMFQWQNISAYAARVLE